MTARVFTIATSGNVVTSEGGSAAEAETTALSGAMTALSAEVALVAPPVAALTEAMEDAQTAFDALEATVVAPFGAGAVSVTIDETGSPSLEAVLAAMDRIRDAIENSNLFTAAYYAANA